MESHNSHVKLRGEGYIDSSKNGFFSHKSIAHTFRNIYVKFQVKIPKIVEMKIFSQNRQLFSRLHRLSPLIHSVYNIFIHVLFTDAKMQKNFVRIQKPY